MNSKEAVERYHFAERSKSELIIASNMVTMVSDFKGSEKTGAKKMLLSLIESFRSELDIAHRMTSVADFQIASDHLGGAVSLIETEEFEKALLKISKAMSAAITPAQESWQYLSDHEFI
ncbi:MAG: hypothetical protein U9N40_06085 [Euryarchaeota archaeon]|nr:hypothetical protein [Euryarchaeota archaeon]